MKGKLAVVWGLGVFGGGLAAVRYLRERGARVRVLDRQSADALASSLEGLSGLGVELVLGREHRAEDFADADLVVKSPAIPPSAPWSQWLSERGVPLTSELLLGLGELEAPFVMVSGSKGKSTTASLLGVILDEAFEGAETVGNNERPLLELILSGRRPERVVIEVSSFMADGLVQARAAGATVRAPELVALTSLVPEHLNWHGSVEDYYAAKLSLLELGPRAVVVPAQDTEIAARVPPLLGGARLVRSGASGAGLDVTVREGAAVTAGGEALFRLSELNLLGEHNLENALVAAAAAHVLGADPAAIARGVARFQPLAHRLETVAVSPSGVRFINDSMATTPASAMAALRAVPAPLVLLAGGSNKGASYGELACVAAAQARAVICLGEIGAEIAQAVRSAVEAGAGSAEVVRVEGGFDDAFRAGLERCPQGGALLLAPATASYDMFPNFKARGERFRELAQRACAR